MNPTQLTAWTQAVAGLIAAGIPIFAFLHGLLTTSHPALTPEQINAAYVAILSDDAVRIAFADRVATGPSA